MHYLFVSFCFDFASFRNKDILAHENKIIVFKIIGLQKLLQFPEEVAILLTDTESRLFNQVPAADYIRQVTIDISRGATINAKVTGVEDLIHRFNEVVYLCRTIFISTRSQR